MGVATDPVREVCLVTGGSGYFGSVLVQELLKRGHRVVSFDLNDDEGRPTDVEFVPGDIRDAAAVRGACHGVDVVYHNVAQVPLARSPQLFEEVNVGGTAVLLEACIDAKVGKVVHTSSSAVFGVPSQNPVLETTPPAPREAYGKAKYEAELLCHAAVTRGLDVSIVRPRTILGHGRLGIFAILFDWIVDGTDVFVLGKGDNSYQFVHAADLAEAIILAGARRGPSVYNIGTPRFGTMRQALEAVTAHAGTGSKVRELPYRPAVGAMQLTAKLGLTPFAPYHWMMYGKSMFFDTSKAESELGWRAESSNEEMLIESYDWFVEHRDQLSSSAASQHRSGVDQGVLTMAKAVLVAISKRL